jgi:hypothetical protein
MSIAVPKQNSTALAIINEFVRDSKRDGLITQLIARAPLLRRIWGLSLHQV